MKYTLLEMTQDILSNMSSDEINSISDSPEALQVATIIKQKYFDIINRVPLPEHEQLIQLDSSLDINSPVLMYVPDHVADIKWLKYFDNDATSGTVPGYCYVTILPIKEFVDMVNNFNPDETDVDSFDFTDNSGNDYTFYYKNNKQPQYCTVISNNFVVFDSFNLALETTLQTSNCMAWGKVLPTWTMTDTFTPDLAEEQFQLLLNEAKVLAFFELKQQQHQLAMQEVKRGWSNIQKNKRVSVESDFDRLPNFGRYRGRYGYK